jgi:hypothetical protein
MTALQTTIMNRTGVVLQHRTTYVLPTLLHRPLVNGELLVLNDDQESHLPLKEGEKEQVQTDQYRDFKEYFHAEQCRQDCPKRQAISTPTRFSGTTGFSFPP